MGACDAWSVEINILVYENKMFSLPEEFHLNNWNIWLYNNFQYLYYVDSYLLIQSRFKSPLFGLHVFFAFFRKKIFAEFAVFSFCV